MSVYYADMFGLVLVLIKETVDKVCYTWQYILFWGQGDLIRDRLYPYPPGVPD